MLYWTTGAIGSSFWPYYARMHSPWPIPIGKTVDVPTGYIQFPKEILSPPRSVADLFYSIFRAGPSAKGVGTSRPWSNPNCWLKICANFLELTAKSLPDH